MLAIFSERSLFGSERMTKIPVASAIFWFSPPALPSFGQGHAAAIHFQRALFNDLAHDEHFQRIVTGDKQNIAGIEQLILGEIAMLHQRI